MLPNRPSDDMTRGLLDVDYPASLGVIIVGLKNTHYAVIIGFYPMFEGQILTLDSHVGMCMGGQWYDVLDISLYMKSIFSNIPNPLRVSRSYYKRKFQLDYRPIRVGMLFARHDEQVGSHIYQVMPFGRVIDCQATAIGANSQEALAYFERNKESFEACTRDQLICHGMKALRKSLENEPDLTIDIHGGIVGVNMPFQEIDCLEIWNYWDMANAMGAF